jgi:peptidoglycan/LPS O-acetylase OafA/YrhL
VDFKALPGSGEPRASSGHRRAKIGESFDPARNSLNFIRLVLAVTVVVSHSLSLGGQRFVITAEDVLNSSPGLIAVFGFFGISGFLIAQSAERNHFGRYLWQRFLRIFPGYWVCLLVTGFVIGAIAWGHGQAPIHCTELSCYLRSSTGPFQYLYHNALLRPNQPGIAGTPRGVSVPGIWNGSLWTLQYEFACYVVLAVLAVVGLLKRRPLMAVLAISVWVIAAYYTFSRTSLPYGQTGFDEARLLGLVPLFFFGALLYLYRDRIPDTGWLAFGSAAVFIGSMWLPFGTAATYAFLPTVSAAVLFSPFLAYPMIWLGIHLPFHRVGARNDYSYGVYVYAWPVQQLLAIWDVPRWGLPTYVVLSVVGTAPFAVASWWLVEKHALKLKRIAPKRVLQCSSAR